MIEYTVKVWENGTKEWYLDGQCHREDGPAIEYANGYSEWWFNGQRHREDGPAVELFDGTKLWYLKGRLLTEYEFNERMKASKVKELTVAEISEKLGYEVKVVK